MSNHNKSISIFFIFNYINESLEPLKPVKTFTETVGTVDENQSGYSSNANKPILTILQPVNVNKNEKLDSIYYDNLDGIKYDSGNNNNSS